MNGVGLVTDERRRIEEGSRVSVAVGQPQQGAWSTWEAVESGQFNRSDRW